MTTEGGDVERARAREIARILVEEKWDQMTHSCKGRMRESGPCVVCELIDLVAAALEARTGKEGSCSGSSRGSSGGGNAVTPAATAASTELGAALEARPPRDRAIALIPDGALSDVVQAAWKVVEGFDQGVFVRDVSRDHESGWGVRLLPYLGALGALQKALAQVSAPTGSPRERAPGGATLDRETLARVVWDATVLKNEPPESAYHAIPWEVVPSRDKRVCYQVADAVLAHLAGPQGRTT